jgi:hypothetical protein
VIQRTTCAAFAALLPYRQQLIHARWSGEACWIPLGDYQLGVGYENHTSHPSRGDLLWYPGGISETELLFAYGSSLFGSKIGQLDGNHFLEIIDGTERLEEMGATCCIMARRTSCSKRRESVTSPTGLQLLRERMSPRGQRGKFPVLLP